MDSQTPWGVGVGWGGWGGGGCCGVGVVFLPMQTGRLVFLLFLVRLTPYSFPGALYYRQWCFFPQISVPLSCVIEFQLSPAFTFAKSCLLGLHLDFSPLGFFPLCKAI